MSYFPIHREHRDRIQKEFGERASTILLVWVALCDIANTEGATFEKRQTMIAKLAGVCVRTTQRAFEDLEQIGFLVRKHTKNQDGGTGACTYTLPPIRNKVAPPTTQGRIPYDSTPATNSRSANIGKTDKKGAQPGTRLSLTERISLERERDRIPESVRDIKAEMGRMRTDPELDEARAKIKHLESRFCEISTRLEAYSE